MAGLKEIEYEVIRDKADNCIVVCNMENFDPVGLYRRQHSSRTPARLFRQGIQDVKVRLHKIIKALNIEGGCNVQFALNPESYEYVVIGSKPRVSVLLRLPARQTGYPIARIATKNAVGFTLDEIKNNVTGSTYSFFEP